MARWIALGLVTVSCLLALNSPEGMNGLLAIGLLDALGLSMIFWPGWFTFWMPLGFWAQRARDVDQADRMGPVVAFIGWLVLLLVLYLATRL